MRWWRWAAGLLLVVAAIALSCGPGNGPVSASGSGENNHGGDGGTVDGGTSDGGSTDGGTTDGGSTDGGTADGGVAWTPPPPINFPTVADWTFYGPQNGGPHDVLQVTSDGDGNVWIAGGEDGLFLLRPGSTQLERFTMADGLRPYGYMPDGSDPVGPKYLNVIAVTGGAGSSVYVGYMGRPGCEGNWDTDHKPAPLYGDPSVYKSGDADHVTLTSTGLKVVHYDIFSGPGMVPNEPQGRERLCTIWRIVWNPATNDLWFGGNHGFAWGDPNYAGDPKCDGQRSCSGVLEHVHPAFNGSAADGTCCDYITEDYRGVAIDPVTGDVWFGGSDRTTKFHWGEASGGKQSRFFAAADWTQNYEGTWPPPSGAQDAYHCPAAPCYAANRIDVWPDAKGEYVQTGPSSWGPYAPNPTERQPQDIVFGIAALPNGGAYVGSGWLGLRRLDAYGTLVSDDTSRLSTKSVGAVARDPIDGTVWVGNRYAGGLHRLRPDGSTDHFSLNTFGNLANMGIEDVQFAVSGGSRKVLVGFRAGTGNAGFVAVYSGN